MPPSQLASVVMTLALIGCATAATIGEGDALSIAKNTSVDFCAKASGCDFRSGRKGDNWLVIADRYYLSEGKGKVFAVDDSLYLTIDANGRVVSSLSLP